MTLKEIFEKMKEFIEENPEIYDNNYEGEDDEIIQEFDELQDSIFSDNQTYFTWDVDGDCFRIDRAFMSVMEYLKDQNKRVKEFYVDYLLDDKMILLIELED